MIKIGNNISSFSTYSYRPANREELKKIINERINKYGTECDLNDIDTSLITDMSWLFYNLDFIGDISNWNTSNVTTMYWMFASSKFNGDISEWDVSNVLNMRKMFLFSNFNKDVSNWKINKECDICDMFGCCYIKEEFKPKSLQK